MVTWICAPNPLFRTHTISLHHRSAVVGIASPVLTPNRRLGLERRFGGGLCWHSGDLSDDDVHCPCVEFALYDPSWNPAILLPAVDTTDPGCSSLIPKRALPEGGNIAATHRSRAPQSGRLRLATNWKNNVYWCWKLSVAQKCGGSGVDLAGDLYLQSVPGSDGFYKWGGWYVDKSVSDAAARGNLQWLRQLGRQLSTLHSPQLSPQLSPDLLICSQGPSSSLPL